MKLILETPTRLYIDDIPAIRLQEIQGCLTYRDAKVHFEVQKLKKSKWFIEKHGIEAFEERLKELKAAEKVCLLNKEGDRYWCLSGFTKFFELKYNLKVQVNFELPEAQDLPWSTVPEHTPYPYQEKALKRLLETQNQSGEDITPGPRRVSMATGTGKTLIILGIVKSLGLKTVIMTPSTSISGQIYRQLLKAFGPRYVGAYFDGKKEFKKLITVGNGQSFTKVTPDSPAGKEFAKVQVFIADESHQCPAETLAKVCTGVLANAPYRYFFSATQIRGDGLELLLDAISGPTVFEMSVKEGVDQGYLAKPVFRMIKTYSSSHFDSQDSNSMTRNHLYYNPVVLQQAAEIINQSVEKLEHQVLVLVSEVEQFTRLLPYIKHQVRFAHGGLSEDNRGKVPKEFWDADPNKLVEQFNKNEFPILVGTSCISTGTDIQTPKTMIYLKGRKSETEVTQGVGRCTRKPEGKTACVVVDFDVANIPSLHRHAMERRKIYNSIYGPVEMVDWD